MKIRWWRWLFHRHKATVPPIWREQRIHDLIGADVASDPGMCEPKLGRPTAHLTRIIYQDETMVDMQETRTMETIVL